MNKEPINEEELCEEVLQDHYEMMLTDYAV